MAGGCGSKLTVPAMPLVRNSATVLADSVAVARRFQARVRVNLSGELSGVGLYWRQKVAVDIGRVTCDESLQHESLGGCRIHFGDQAPDMLVGAAGAIEPVVPILVA